RTLSSFTSTTPTTLTPLSLHDALPIYHQVLSFDAYLKFIEDDFLGGQRIDAGDGRPDPRTDVREALPILGNLVKDFDFSRRPRRDRKSTRLNSSHLVISYAVFCLKKKT